MNKKIIFGLIFIFLFSYPSLMLLNSYHTNALNNNFNNQLDSNSAIIFDGYLQDYINDPAVKEVPIIITFKEGISSNFGWELINILSINSLELEYIFTYFNGVSGVIDKNYIINLADTSFIEKVYLDREYNIGEPTDISDDISLNAIYDNGLEAISADILNNLDYNGENIKIAILDSGIDNSHPDFSGRIIAEKSFVENEDTSDLNGHGTHVAGIAAGSGAASNGLYRGVATQAQIINAKCASASGIAFTSDIIAAIEWSVTTQHADILSISLGGGLADPDDPLSIAVDQAAENGAVVCISAGNSGPEYATVGIPAAGSLIISVGATDFDDKITDFSSRGPTLDNRVSPDLVAPGYQIIAPLSSGSVFDYIADTYGLLDASPGSGQYAGDNYYVALSGTSMSAPFVAGAAALLLSAFPNLKGNSQAIKAVFMETAEKLTGVGGIEYSPNVQGSGKINVTAAYYYLEANYDNLSNSVPITVILPDVFPIEPYKLLYPGQSVEVNIKFLTGEELNLTVDNIISENASEFIFLGNDTYSTNTEWNITVQNYLDIGLTINIPLNATSGSYFGRIELFNESLISIHNITISFDIEIPIARVYFDMLHNYDIEDSQFINYRSFMNDLMASGYQIEFGEYLLTYELIRNFDLIILPDIEIQLFDFEIQALQNYISEGGNVLVLGSYYPLFAAESLNQFLSSYGIQYNSGYEGNIMQYSDLGPTRTFSLLAVTDLVSHPITTGVSSYIFGAGLGLIVNSPAQTIARFSGSSVLAAYDNSSISGGRVVVFSNELSFYSDNLVGSNIILLHNTLNWLLKEDDTLVTVSLENTFIENSGVHTEYATIFVSYNGSPLTGLLNGTNIFCHLNDTTPLFVDEIGEGVYTINFTTSLSGTFKLNVTVEYGSEVISDFAQLIIVNNSPQIISFNQQKLGTIDTGISYPDWVNISGLSDDLIISKFGESVNITVNVDNAEGVILGLNSNFQDYYDITQRSITYEIINMNFLGGSIYNYTIIPTSLTYNASSYPYILIPYNNSIGTINPSEFVVGYFVIVGTDPVINDNENTIAGTTIDNLEKYDFGEGIQLPIYYYSFGTSVSLQVAGQDIEDTNQVMRAYVWLLDIVLYYYLGNPLNVIELNFDSGTNTFTNNLLIQSNVIQGPAGSFTLFGNYPYSLIFYLIDSEGDLAVSQQVILVFEQPFSFLSDPFILLFGGLIAFSVVMFLYQRRNMKKRREQFEKMSPPYPVEVPGGIPTDAFLFCPHCGSRINPGDIYCLSCGEKLRDEDDFSYFEEDPSDKGDYSDI